MTFEDTDFNKYSIGKDCFVGTNSIDIKDAFQQYKTSVLKLVSQNQKIVQEENSYKNSGVFSLKDFENKFSLMGNVRVPGEEFENIIDTDIVLDEFFNEDRVFSKGSEREEEVHLTGFRYVVALDPNLSKEKKTEILSQDLLDALDIIQKVQREEIEITEENRIYYVGVFRYAVNAAITFFNAFIIREKISEFNINNPEYIEWRTFMEHVIEYTSDALCSLFVGKKVDPPKERYDFDAEEVPQFCEAFLEESENYHFQRPEATNLSRILGTAYLFAKDNPNLDTIINMPSGGTQISYVLNWVYKHMYGRKKFLIHNSVSSHSIKHTLGKNKHIDPVKIDNYLDTRKGKIRDKVVGGLDDNSSTGGTLDKMKKYLAYGEAKETILGVVEADIIRSDINLDTSKSIASPETYKYSIGILPVSKIIDKRKDIKELKELQILKKRYEDLLESVDNEIDFIKYSVMLDNLQNPVIESDMEGGDSITCFKRTFLSNFSKVEVELDGVLYPSIENAYISAKYKDIDIGKNKKVTPRTLAYINDKLTESGNDALVTAQNIGPTLFSNKNLSSRDAVMISQELEIRGVLRKDWSQVKMKVMIELLLQKFTQHSDYRENLLQTGDKMLIEGNAWGDSFWGYDTNIQKGNNFLGRILMYIRDCVLKEQNNQSNILKQKGTSAIEEAEDFNEPMI